MSKKRHSRKQRPGDEDASLVVRTYAVRHTDNCAVSSHAHEWHQLIYACEGVMWVRTAQGDWVVPPSRAVWVPAGVEHGIELGPGVLVQTLYLAARFSVRLPGHCCAVNVSPLLRELVIHTVRLGTLDCREATQARLFAFLLDQLAAMPTLPTARSRPRPADEQLRMHHRRRAGSLEGMIAESCSSRDVREGISTEQDRSLTVAARTNLSALQLPRPHDNRARRVADWLEAHPSDPGHIRPAARRAGLGVRTLERLFRRETGMTFGKWRQQLRLIHSLRLLAAGHPVTSVALDVGYDSPSAFIAMFKNALGTTPRQYFARSRQIAE